MAAPSGAGRAGPGGGALLVTKLEVKYGGDNRVIGKTASSMPYWSAKGPGVPEKDRGGGRGVKARSAPDSRARIAGRAPDKKR